MCLQVVQERTAEIRNVIDNQTSVVQRLKTASDSFDELQDEIRQIRQTFIETAMRREATLDDIAYERRFTGGGDLDDDDVMYGKSHLRYAPVSNSAATLDKDLESDSIVNSGALHNLASLRSSGAYDGGSSVRSRTSDTMTSLRRSMTDFDDDFTSLRSRRRNVSFDDYSDLDPVESSSQRSLPRYSTANYEDDDDALYSSPNLPSYRRYEPTSRYDATSDVTSGYSSWRSRSYATDVSDVGSSASGDADRTSRYLPRSYTLGSYSTPTRSVRDKYSSASTGSSGFTSRFLNKVREKKASGENVARDNNFSSRFLTGSVSPASPKTSAYSPGAAAEATATNSSE